MLIAGTFSFNSQPEAARIAKAIANKSVRHNKLCAEPLYTGGGAHLYIIKRKSDESHIEHIKQDSLHEWLISDINYIHPSKRQLKTEPEAYGRWISLKINENDKSIAFTTDVLGSLWLYYAAIPDGYAFSNDFGALAKSLPYSLKINKNTIKMELALTYCPDETTIFKQINVLKPAAVTEFSKQNISITPYHPIAISGNLNTSPTKHKHQNLDEIFHDICENYIKPNPNIVLSLSAGYDSRYALALLKKHDIKMEFCTFGDPKSSEVLNSEKVASFLESHTNVFNYERGEWDEWINSIETLGNTGMIQWNGWSNRWLQFKRTFGTASVIGYLGDALSGKHLGKDAANISDGIDYWLDWSTKGDRLNSPFMKDAFKKSIRNQIKEILFKSINHVDIEFPYQQALYLDLYGRQRRRVANQANLIERHLTPLLFFYHKPFIEFCLQLPVEDLSNQSLYRRYANSRFPEIFGIYDQMRPPKSSEKVKNKLHSMISKFNKSANVYRKPNVIDHSKLINPNKEKILELANTVEPIIGSTIDLQPLKSYLANPNSVNANSHQVIQIINLCILARLAI